MFKNLLSFWKGKDFLVQVLEDFRIMLDDSESMFEMVCSVDVNACLILMSVVKDAERLGDYSKNLYEVTELLAQPIERELFSEYFDELDKKILALFQQTKEAFIDANEEQARSAWEYEKTIAKGCDKIVERLAQSNLPVNQAVCFTLVARHFKRIVAHLVNIATAVILPLSDIDYFDERTREG
ncbi:MAG: PhoU domain-containing protein [Planctomycetota bacterium]|jgi:phosphate uptake regulator